MYRRVLTEILESRGCLAESASTGQRALESLISAVTDDHPFDLVVLDSRMPDMDGIEIERAIRADARLANTKVVFFGTPGDRKQWHQQEVEETHSTFLIKPMRQMVFLDALVAIFDGGARASRVAAAGGRADRRRFRARILLLDDLAVNRKVAEGILRKGGHDVTAVGNGREALDILDQGSFDIVLTDLQMPELDGFELTKRIRADDRWRSLPIIAMTAHALKGDRERCLEAGMDDHLTKPIISEHLLAMVDKWAPRPGSPAQASKTPVHGPTPGTESDSPANRELDIQEALERLGGDRALLAEVLTAFLEDLPEMMAELETAVSQADAERICAAAHALKGAALNIGAGPTCSVSQELEQVGKKGTLHEAVPLLEKLQGHAELLQQYVTSLKDE
jgi:CheY-like chemotaxis protein/HPt (histidine-containing phosphotransfer) domain-containing protein